MHQYNVKTPSERISTVNIAGPFPDSLAIDMDGFTKWQEISIIPNQETTMMAYILVANFFCCS
jgi:hypothetical protein